MRISDWSSDVCSSDLRRVNETGQGTMPRVDFYRLTRDPIERVLPALATRILANGDRLLVVAASAMRRQAIDEALWTLNRASFLPHGHAGSPDEAIEPILISGTLDPSPPNMASLIALADGEWTDEAPGLDRKSTRLNSSHSSASRMP